MQSFVKFRSKLSRRRQARRFSPWQSALERLEERVLLTDPTISAPSPQTTAEDTAKAISGLSFADDAVDTIEVTVTLAVTNGTLFVKGNVSGGVTSTDITGNGTATVTITALQAALNATLADAAGLTFTSTADFNGGDTLAISINDNENGNAGMSLSASTNVSLNVTAVNDAPSFTIASNPPSVNEDAGFQSVASFATAIAKGPANESSQTVTNFTVTSVASTGGLTFVIAPSIDPVSGALTYQSAANSNGTATFNVTLTDNGSGTAPNVNTSAVQTFIISVAAVNDAPSFTKGENQTVLEDAGEQTVSGWATNISAGTNEPGQTVTFTVVADTLALFIVQPAISSAGVLTYTPAVNANGSATVTVTASDGSTSSAPQTFTINVTAINDAPTFTLAGNPASVNEDAGLQTVAPFATAMSQGPTNESSQSVTNFTVTSIASTGGLTFLTAPSINPLTGTLTYQAAADSNGTATFSVTLSDNGSGTAPNVNISPVQTFTITVNAVNDAPSFTKGANQTVLEDAGEQTVSGWATNISAGTNEPGQTVTFTVVADTLALFIVQPAISSAGVLTYTPAVNANGSATVTVTASDGSTSSAPQTFTINVTAINDAPIFTLIANPATSTEDAGLQVVGGFASGIAVGPATAIDEPLAPQTISNFTVTAGPTTGGLTFLTAPSIDPNTGTLTYQAAANANGTATFTVTLTDSGSNTSPNVNTSASKTFVITVTAVNDAPTIAAPGMQTTPQGTAKVISGVSFADVDAGTSNVTVTLSAPGGKLTVLGNVTSGVTTSQVSQTTVDGIQTTTITAPLAAINATLANASGLTYAPNALFFGFDSLSININDGTGGLSTSNSSPLTIFVTPSNGAVVITDATPNVTYTATGNAKLRAVVVNGLLLVSVNGIAYPFYQNTGSIVTLTINGGSKNDEISLTGLSPVLYPKLTTIVINGNAGNDTIKLTGLTATAFPLLASITINGGAGNDTIIGSDIDNAITGGSGNDKLTGGAGKDTIIGGTGNDTLKGGAGDDTLIGGFGKDSIDGEAGTNKVLGGQGGPTRGGKSKKDSGDVVVVGASGEIDETFNTVFAFE